MNATGGIFNMGFNLGGLFSQGNSAYPNNM